MTDIQYSFKKKMMAWILSICLVVTLIPEFAFAVTGDNSNERISPEEVTMADIVEKTENITTYDLGGGEKMSVFHGGQVRFEDDKGKLVDYDPSLETIETGETSLQDEPLQGYSYTNKAGDKKHYLPVRMSENTPVRMEYQDYAIEFSLTNESINKLSVNNEVVKKEEATIQTAYDDNAELPVNAVYGDEDSESQITYTSTEDSVKETLILNEKPETNVFQYKLNLTGMFARKNVTDGAITYYDNETEEITGFIAAPWMNDATGQAYSEDITYELEEVEGEEGEYLLTMTIDEEYLNDPDRQYPVTIDPTNTWQGSSEVKDVYVISGSTYGNTNFYESGTTKMPSGKNSTGTHRTYIKFIDLKAVTSGKTISSAKFTAYQSPDCVGSQSIGIYRITESWSISTLTYNNRPTCTTCYDTITTSSTDYAAKTWDVITFVKNVANGSISNYGLQLYNKTSSPSFGCFIGSRASSYKPKLVVTYTDTPTTATSASISPRYVNDSTTASVTFNGITAASLARVEYKVAAYDDDTATVGSTVIPYSANTAITNGGKLPSLEEGCYRVSVRGVNSAGTAGTGKSAGEVHVDKTAPTMGSVTFKDDSGNDINNVATEENDPVIAFTDINDKHIGTTGILYALIPKGAALQTSDFKTPDDLSANAAKPYSGTFTLNAADTSVASGEYTLYVRAKDLAGNTKTKQFTYIKDTEAPTGSISITDLVTGNEVSQLSKAVNVEVTVDGTGSEIKESSLKLYKAVTGSNGAVTGIDESTEVVVSKNFTISENIIFDTLDICDSYGKYRFVLSIKDSVGKTKTVTKDFDVVYTLPAPDKAIIAASTGGTATLTWEFSYTPQQKIKLASIEGKFPGTSTFSQLVASEEDDSLDFSGTAQIQVPDGEGTYNVTLRGVSQYGHKGAEIVVPCIVDKTAPQVSVTGMDQGYLRGSISDSNLKEWKIYAKEKTAAEFLEEPVGSGNYEVNDYWIEFIDLTKAPFEVGEEYTLKVVVEDKAGNTAQATYDITVPVDQSLLPTLIEPQILIEKGRDNLSFGGFILGTERETLEITNGVENAEWYINNRKTSNDLSNLSEEILSRDWWNDVLALKDESDGSRKYSVPVVLNGSKQQIDFNAAQSGDTTVEDTIYSVESIVSFRITADTEAATYQIKADTTTEGEYITVIPGTTYYITDMTEESAFANTLTVKATANTGKSISDANLMLHCDTIVNDSFIYTDVENYAPKNLSAEDKINYKTYLKWDIPAEIPNNVSYRVYRGTEEDFMADETTLIADDIRAGYFTEINAVHGKDFYYKVCAVKTYSDVTGMTVEVQSSFSDTMVSRAVDQNESVKRLGTKEFWEFTEFNTPNGNGYIEKSKGNFLYQQRDAQIPNEGFDVNLTRAYNSQATTKGMFGFGWSHDYDIELLNVCENNSLEFTHVILKDGNGTIYHFTRSAGDEYFVSSLGSYVNLTAEDTEKTKSVTILGDENGSRELKYQFILSTKDGEKYYFNSGGQLILMEDANEQFVVFERDINNGVLTKMLTNNNIDIEFIYNSEADGKDPLTVKEIILPDGTKVAYEYSSPLLSKYELLTKVSVISGTEVIEYEYEYDKPMLSSKPHNLTKILEPENKYQYKINYDFESDQVSDVVYPNDEKFTFTYAPDSTCTATKKYSGGQFVLGEKDYFDRVSGECEKSIRGISDETIVDGTSEDGLDVTTYNYRDHLLISSSTTAQYYEINDNGYVVERNGTKTKTVSYSGDNPTKEIEEDGAVSEYTYYTEEDGEHLDALIKTVKETNASGKVASYKKYNYDSVGNVIEVVDYVEKTKITNSYYTEGAFKGELHTMKEYLITVSGSDQVVSESLKSTSVYSYQYDTVDSVTTKTESCTQTIPMPDGSSEVITTSTQYDLMGRVIKETDDRGYQTINTYDGFGRVTDTTYKYSDSDQLKRHTQISYDKNGMITKAILENDIEESFTYDNMGRVVSTTVSKVTETGITEQTINTTYRYEDVDIYQGKGTDTVTINNAYVTKQAYSDGTVISEIYEDHCGNIVRAYEGGLYTDMTYSSQGDMITMWCMGQTLSATEGILEIYIYDDKGNLTESIADPDYVTGTNTTGFYVRPDGIDEEGNAIQGSIVNKSKYDEDGNVIEQIDPLGNSTQYTYDKNGSLLSVLLPNQAKYEYKYDVEGENNTTMDIVLEPRVTGTDSDRLMSKSIVVKDSTDRTIKVEDLGTSDSDNTSISTSYEYDVRDNLIKATEKNGDYKAYTYDVRDRVTAIDYYEKSGDSATKTLKTEFTYDDADNLTVMIDKEIASGEEVIYRYTAYGYDGFNRLIWVSENNTNTTPTETDINANKVSYGYDIKDRLVSIDYANSNNGVNGLRFTYNTHGWLTKVDAVNNNNTEKTIREYSYADDGVVSEITDYTDFLNGTSKWLKRSYTYDKFNRVIAIDYTDNMTGSSSEIKETYSYEYDKNNNIVSESKQNLYGVVNGADYSESYSYMYDANNRLIFNSYYKMATEDESGDSAEITYTYDAAGNRISEEILESGATSSMSFENTYTYNEFNQLTESVEESLDDYVSTEYTYDQNGNQISKTDTDLYTETQIGQTTYTYDAANRLKTATGTTGDTVDYTQENKYNGFGQRVEKKEGTDVTNYFYDGTAVLYTTDAEDNKTSFNLIGAEDNILSTSRIGADSVADFYVYTKDVRESTTNVIGSDGLAEVSYTYDEYGETTEYQQDENDPFYNEICYTAGVYDATTGLYNLNARYYSPAAGTFLTQDTYRGSLSRTSTLNYYAYCAGNPISYTDPSGHAAWAIAGAALGAYDGYQYAKKKNLKGWKKVAAIAGGAALGAVNPFKVVKAVKTASKVVKASKYTKAAVSAKKTTKVVKKVKAKPKQTIVAKKSTKTAAKTSTAKKTTQTIKKQQKTVKAACFTAGTKIHTKDGYKNIEAIKVGDYVWSENPETKEKALKKVKKIFVREKDSIVRLAINGEAIETTDEHPFYVEGKGFTEAKWLKVGDEVRLATGDTAEVETIESVKLDSPVKVYNFEVEDFHTYYVSGQKVLVHNTCGGASGSTGTQASSSEVRHSPINPGDLDDDIAANFTGGSYTARVLTEDTIMYRVYGGKASKVGSYLSRTPQNGGLQSQMDLALNPAWGNTAEYVSKVIIPKGTKIYEGSAAPQAVTDNSGNIIGHLPGGGNQVYIPSVNARWFN